MKQTLGAVLAPVIIVLVAIPLSKRFDLATAERFELTALCVAAFVGGTLAWRAARGSRGQRLAAVAVYLIVVIPLLVFGSMIFACVMYPRCG